MIPKRPAECFLTLDDTQLLTLCIYGETGKKLVTAHQLGVASCVMNRVKNLAGSSVGITLKDVILAPRQFACFQEGNPNRLGLMAIACGWDKAFQRNRHLRECFRIAEGVMNGDLPDNVSGATHYKKNKDQAPWSNTMKLVAVIGEYEFYA
ncbi:MAG: cell wall hydrolase [Syntrophorhabdaceae bacterium]|nr:cell wall hydrolase [Syntrophorhabdaceae bacterium]